jgi:hypothetical protein
VRSAGGVLILVVLAAAGAGVAASQGELVFSTLGIDLWPGYDRPGVLVIYRGTLAPGTALPAQLTLTIPAAAGAPSALAERRSDGQLVNLTYERRVDGEVAFIETTVTRPELQMEFYAPAITRADAAHSFDFAWPGDYAVGELTVTVQQPDLAQELVTEPPASRQAPGGDGFVYHTVPLGARATGETAEVSVTYEKVSDQLSVETRPAAPAATPAPPAAASRSSSDGEVGTIVIAVLAILVVGALVSALIRARRTATPPSAGWRRESGAGARFCTQCSAAAGSADRFCHRCGAALL